MVDIVELHGMLPDHPGEHFCIAPFQSTRQNAYGRTSPCAFGAGEWRYHDLSPAERWNAAELNQLRLDFIQGRKPTECFRCWDEEKAGKKSLRQRQLEYYPNDYRDFIKSGMWLSGPKTTVFKTSNVCNLACRSCGGWDTNTYTQEGHYYADTYSTKVVVDGEETVGNRFIPLLPPKHMDFMRFIDISQNLEKIDFFGGEPFLNITQLDLLEYLADRGLSKNITLFYSTNCTNQPTDRLKRAWDKFRRIEISVSIDGIADQFEYLRWPGKWQEFLAVLDHIKRLPDQLDCEVYRMAGLTVSLLNAWDVGPTEQWIRREIGDIYINMVNSPRYLNLHVAPDHVKSKYRQRVTNSEVLGYLDIEPFDPLSWKQFIIWTKRQDLYRNQDFSKTFPDFYSAIQKDWDSITDLSESNFYSV